MGLRALNNSNSAFEDVFSNTGTEAATAPSPLTPDITSSGGTQIFDAVRRVNYHV